MMNDQSKGRCPRCRMDRLRTWGELTEEGREVVRRLAQSAEYPEDEREATHRWCVNCWYEETEPAPLDA